MRIGENRTVKVKVENVAQGFLELLALREIDYFFANAGTDFASIVDGFARRETEAKKRPRPLAVPHEIPLVSMAHGYHLLTGKPQAAMVHVGVGTANSLGGIMAAARARIPILFCAGRTPITEEGHSASRDAFIHWAQESFDQTAAVREFVKWDYELRTPSQLEAVVDRALAMAMTEPCGPVYLTLPREVLATSLGEVTFGSKARYDLPTSCPDPARIQEAAGFIREARFPVIITSSAGRSPSAVQALVEVAEAGAMGVISFNPEYMNFPTSHQCHLGFSPAPFLEDADVILVLDCDVPWYPSKGKPGQAAVIITAGIDPLYSRYPMRSFPSDITIQGPTDLVLSALRQAILKTEEGRSERIEARRETLRSIHEKVTRSWKEDAFKGAREKPAGPEWVASCVNKILQDDTVLVNEPDNGMKPFTGQRPGSYFSTPHQGYLGWGFGAALGVKLARPDSLVVATLGDGSYMFAVPSACHSLALAHGLPILVVVYNNQGWNAVRRSTRAVHPDGWAARTNNFPLSELPPGAAYEKICEAFGGYGERVEAPGDIEAALERAARVVREEKRQALVNIRCKGR